eukprot:CAMPEP_0184682244 /NCGR_PEP_ID=MMETSP0312-20130426/6463_1 /TAXON_ID=31354 /ORGANISM="Compsopogon coeruleus, Strain SAG 36.94" /LENGTH=781 /DNA_ID=CAMNT_0027133779 /DNA_START=55 /DNA_END=2400 /DNA_ORIENTATION=+
MTMDMVVMSAVESLGTTHGDMLASRPSSKSESDEAVSSILLVLWIAAVGFLLVAFRIASWVLSKSEGPPALRKVSDPIREGAYAFFVTQYGAIARLSLILALVLFLSYRFRPVGNNGGDTYSPTVLATICVASFLVGGALSGVSGLIAMWVAVRSNVRVCAQAIMGSYNGAIQVAFRAGAFASILIVSLCLFGLVFLYTVVWLLLGANPLTIPMLIVGYGFGASYVALFAQLGGGIYTKAADVGADIVGKIEKNIPEDDPRNPAVIADLVGDNVGDCAGRGADLFESIAAENIGAMILGATLASTSSLPDGDQVSYTLFPLILHGMGLCACAIGVLAVGTRSDPGAVRDEETPVLRGRMLEDPMVVMKRGLYVTIFLSIVGMWFLCSYFLYSSLYPSAWWRFAICGTMGILTSLAFVVITEHYTDYLFYPVRSVAESSQYGHGTNVIRGIAVGLESTFPSIIVLSIAILVVYSLGYGSGLPDKAAAGVFGTAVATMGMLSSASFILAMDVFGPIADNAGGISEMSMQGEEVRVITDRLDAVGNTTKALTKGYAVGSASMAAFLLFRAFLDEINSILPEGLVLKSIDLAYPEVFIAGLLGGAMVFLFSSLSMSAVGKSAQAVVTEVRRQFNQHPGILNNTETPDYGKCVSMVASSALKEMILPGVLAVTGPILTGLVFKMCGRFSHRPLLGVQAAGGQLMVGTIAGVLVALFFNNAGGAWDNAKKYIESGAYGGKNSEAHKAAVTGDTVGDPFKDTCGPSIHVLIKLLATITLVVGPLYLAL